MKKILVTLIAVALMGSANMFAMDKLTQAERAKVITAAKTAKGDEQKFQAAIKSMGAKVVGITLTDALPGAPQPVAVQPVQQAPAPIVAPAPTAPAPAAAVSQGGRRKHYRGGQCPRKPGGMKFRGPGRGKFRTPEERVSRMVRRAALSAGNIQDANALIVSMQQAVRDLANDPDIQNLPVVSSAVVPAVAPQAPVARQFKQKFGGRRYGKHQHKLRTPDEMVERIRCIALSKGNGPGANAFITAVEKAIGDLANDQKIKRLPNK